MNGEDPVEGLDELARLAGLRLRAGEDDEVRRRLRGLLEWIRTIEAHPVPDAPAREAWRGVDRCPLREPSEPSSLGVERALSLAPRRSGDHFEVAPLSGRSG